MGPVHGLLMWRVFTYNNQNEIYQRLIDDGFEIEPPQRHHAWTFYIQAPGGFTVEVPG